MAVYLALGVLCVLLTSRWWLPAVLPRVLGLVSVEVASVERLDGGGLHLSKLSIDGGGTRIEVDWVTLPSEWVLLKERFIDGWSAASTLRIGQVGLWPTGTEDEPKPSTADLYLPQLVDQAQSGLDLMDRWLPPIIVESVRWSDGGGAEVFIRSVDIRGRQMAGVVTVVGLEGRWAVEADLETGALWRLNASHVETGFSGTVRMESLGETVEVKGEARGADSLLEYSAEFGDSSWWPLDAGATSEGFVWPGIGISLGSGMSLDELELTDLEVVSQGKRFTAGLKGVLRLQAGEAQAESVTYALEASGDAESVRVEALSLQSGWASLRLSEPLTVDWRQRSFEGEAQLTAEFDLSEQQWFDARGVGRAEFDFDSESLESLQGLRFSLQASDLAFQNYTASGIAARGGFEGETLRLDSLTLTPMGADGGDSVNVAGAVDFGAETVDLEYSVLLGAEWVNGLVGQSIFGESLKVEDGRVLGPWGAPKVSGQISTLLQTEATEPINLSGVFRWDGATSVDWTGAARSGGAEIFSEMSAKIAEDEWSVQIASLRWRDPERPELLLESPFSVSFLPGDGPLEERLSLSALTLRGADMGASVAYDPSEGLKLSLANVSLERVDRWLKNDLPSYHVESIACTITEFRPFILGTLQISAEERIDAEASVRLELSALFEKEQTKLERVALLFSGEKVLMGQAQFPLRLRVPGDTLGESFYNLGSGALSGTLSGNSSSPAFSEWLQMRTGVRLKGAVLDLQLAGDLGDPTGHLNLQVSEVGLGSMFPEVAMPRIQALELDLKVNERVVDIQTLAFSLNESAVHADLQVPVAALSAQAVPDPEQWLRAASGTIRLDNWEMENWVDWTPASLRRSGRLIGSLQLAPDLDLTGTLNFEEFGLRPTESMAAVDQIGGRIRVADRIVRIEEATARLGGSVVELVGRIDLTDWAEPRWSFDVAGKNVPIQRTTEMILRSDLDIRLAVDDSAEAPLLSGELRLRSSTLLVDFDPLAPRLKKGSGVGPPFFRITEEPFADWRFDLRLKGDSFMRVRSPYFRTKLSADLRLGGTFAEPELLGSVRTLAGELNFPGAKFSLEEGEAYIEASRPNEVQLSFNGVAQKASRVIVMEVSQTLEDPLIQFQSTPPMSQADIVRLLATGSTSGGGVGNIGLYLGQAMLGAGSLNEGLADKLTVDVGEETSRSGRNTLGVRYELSPAWSLEGEYDAFDAYNADLIWSIFRR